MTLPRSMSTVGWTLLAFVLISLSLRSAISSVPPVLDTIQFDLSMSATTAGLLTALPVLIFGICAPLGGRLAARVGLKSSLAGCLAVMTVGGALRAFDPVWLLWAGTVILAFGVAVANVLMPPLIRVLFPRDYQRVIGVYIALVGLGAAIAAGATAPLMKLFGGNWRYAIAAWSVLSLTAVVVWSRTSTRRLEDPRSAADPGPEQGPGIAAMARSALLWQITAVMALQSFQYQSLAAWMPKIYLDSGLGSTSAGLQLSLYTLLGIPASVLMTALLHRTASMVRVVLAMGLVNLTGLVGLLLLPAALPVLWSCLLGVSQGAALALALTLMLTRTRSTGALVRVSSVAHSVGYLLASLGPVALGWSFDRFASWNVGLVGLLLVLALYTRMSVLAARERYL